jgi:hypothetical protein
LGSKLYFKLNKHRLVLSAQEEEAKKEAAEMGDDGPSLFLVSGFSSWFQISESEAGCPMPEASPLMPLRQESSS